MCIVHIVQIFLREQISAIYWNGFRYHGLTKRIFPGTEKRRTVDSLYFTLVASNYIDIVLSIDSRILRQIGIGRCIRFPIRFSQFRKHLLIGNVTVNHTCGVFMIKLIYNLVFMSQHAQKFVILHFFSTVIGIWIEFFLNIRRTQ